jgi:hypothetical protein
MADSTPAKHRRRVLPRRRFAPVALVAGVAASGAIALSMNGTLAGFVAQITNSTNTAGTGYIAMQEANAAGTTTCNSNGTGTSAGITSNVATCSTINKYGGSTTMVPGVAVATTITIKNTGTVAANTFTLAPGTCTQSNNGSSNNGSATDICSKMTVAVTQDGSAVSAASGTLAGIAGKTVTLTGPIAAGSSSTFVFTVTLPTQNTVGAPTADNAYQGLAVSQPLVWSFTS